MWDVLVAGGGVSGCIAAIAAARNGAKTLVVERYGFLGGTLTNAGVGPMMTFHAGDTQVVRGIAQELVDRLCERDASTGPIEDTTGYASSITPFDAEQLKYVLDMMLAESGAHVLFHTQLAGAEAQMGIIRAVELCNKAGLSRAEARVYIDATGDADLCNLAGAATSKGRDGDGFAQPMTANMKLYNVDIAALKAYITAHPENFNIRDLSALHRSPRLAVAGFYRELEQAKREGAVSTPREDVLLFETANPGEVIVNATRVVQLDATDPGQRSRAEQIGRQQANELFHFLRGRAAGFERAVFASTGVEIGVRESRHLLGRYVLTADDLLSSRAFGDAVACGGYPIDIHNPVGGQTHTIHLKKGQHYQIPYASLVARRPRNLLASGRCISATHEACAAIRVTPIAMAIGQAAGTAAALCAAERELPADLDVAVLQQRLKAQGAFIDPWFGE